MRRLSDHEIGGPSLRAGAILRRAGPGARGVEVGVFRGALSQKLLDGGVVRLFMVDNWLPAGEQPEHYKATGDWHSSRPIDGVASDERKAREVARRSNGRAVVMKMPSVEAARQINDGSMDFVFLDADHSYDGVRADIDAWLPKVRKGGWIGGHDLKNHMKEYDFSGVDRAVAEFSAKYDIPIEEDDNFTWFARV